MKIPKIADSEWIVMKILWDHAPQTANEVIDALADSVTWNPPTIRTLLNRLVKKGALSYEKDGRSFLFSPLIAEEDCVRAERSSFLKRVYGGALTPMLTQFLEDETLTKKEIQALKKLLDEKGRGK